MLEEKKCGNGMRAGQGDRNKLFSETESSHDKADHLSKMGFCFSGSPIPRQTKL